MPMVSEGRHHGGQVDDLDDPVVHLPTVRGLRGPVLLPALPRRGVSRSHPSLQGVQEDHSDRQE